MLVRWKRPCLGKLKLNIDGLAQGTTGLAGGGGVLRDYQGNWVLGYSRKIGKTTSFLAEWWALRDGLHLCCRRTILMWKWNLIRRSLWMHWLPLSNQTIQISQYLPSWMIVGSWLLDSTTFSSSTASTKQRSVLIDLLWKVSCKLMILSSMITPRGGSK